MSIKIDTPCQSCGREEDGKWFKPCPSDDCPSHWEEKGLVNPAHPLLKPVAGKPFSFEMPMALDQLTDCGDADGLNTLMDEFFWDKYGEEFILGSISYKPIRINEDETIVIQVTAETVEAEEE